MLEMFTDSDPLRLDDYKMPADGPLVQNKKACYNNYMVEDRPPPLKSEESKTMKNLTLSSVIVVMDVQHEATEKTPITVYVPKKGEMVTVRHPSYGYNMPVLSVSQIHKTDSIIISFEQVTNQNSQMVFNTEEDFNGAKLVYDVWRLK